MKTNLNNTTQIPIFHCDECKKYLNRYITYYDLNDTPNKIMRFKCKCGNEIYPQYPNNGELRKMKLKQISG